jgi:multidrug efflux pump subunit AcrB
VDVRVQQRLDAPDQPRRGQGQGGQLGLTQESVVKNVVTALNSSINFAPSFWIDEKTGNHYFIGAQYREEGIHSLDTVLDIPLTSRAQPVPVSLRNLVRFSRSTGPLEINHLNITRVVDLFVNVRGGDVGGVADPALRGRHSARPPTGAGGLLRPREGRAAVDEGFLRSLGSKAAALECQGW